MSRWWYRPGDAVRTPRLRLFCFPLEALIVSGCRGSLVQPQTRASYDASSDALWAWLAEIDGAPAAVLENPQLRALAEPTLHADLKLADTRTGAAEIVDMPIVSFGGTNDRFVPRRHIEGWRNFTARTYRHVEFEGGHFFIHTLERDVLAEISQLCRAA